MDIRLDESTALAELRSLMAELPDGTVFGAPVERGGVTLVPAAQVRVRADTATTAPTGAFAIIDGTVRWVPAVDVIRANLGWQVVAAVGIVVGGSTIRRFLSRAAS